VLRITPPWRAAARRRQRTFTTREARMDHIARRLEAGWTIRLSERADGRCVVRLDYGLIFRVGETIEISRREHAYYRTRQTLGRHLV
jgi:hypothetical protein